LEGLIFQEVIGKREVLKREETKKGFLLKRKVPKKTKFLV